MVKQNSNTTKSSTAADQLNVNVIGHESADDAYVNKHYPPYLKLLQVQFVHRHGERTPIGNYLPGLVPQHWPLCHLSSFFAANVQEYQSRLMANAPVAVNDGGNDAGDTPTGGHSQYHPSEEYPDREFWSTSSTVQEPHLTEDGGNSAATSEMPSYISRDNLNAVGHIQKRIEEPGHIEAGLHRTGHLGKSGDAVRVPPGTCFFGQLTDKGRETHYRLGTSLRQLYVDKLRFLPPVWDSSRHQQHLYVRSTDYPRTVESVQHLLGGIYPRQYRRGSPTVYTRFHGDETLFGDSTCLKWRRMVKDFSETWKQNNKEFVAGLNQKFKQLVDLPSKPNLHMIQDTLIALYAHNIKLPSHVEPADMLQLEKYVNNLWFRVYQSNDEAVRLGIGRFINEMKQVFEWRIKQVVDGNQDKNYSDQDLTSSSTNKNGNNLGQDELKMAIYSGHDSTLGPVLGMLKLDDDRWPAFASNLTFELLQDTSQVQQQSSKSPSSSLYIRSKYNGVIRQLPFCQAKGKHHPKHKDLCTLDAFFDRMEQVIPKDYKQECKL
ncbi:hypothetical protein MP228_002579 [Amoeboaphelidium protococcarum]|nr:hypothetical protein MP228_002579 [Amoeboaphelidium protococcarum]